MEEPRDAVAALAAAGEEEEEEDEEVQRFLRRGPWRPRDEERPGASGALLIAEGAKRSSPTPSTRDRLLGVRGGPGALRATCASVTATRMQLK